MDAKIREKSFTVPFTGMLENVAILLTTTIKFIKPGKWLLSKHL